MASRFQALAMLSRIPAAQIGRRFTHSSSAGAFQVISRRGNHFWSSEDSGVDVEAEASSSSGSGSSSSGIGRKLDVAEEERITQAAPDWIPLVPGSSYWVPSEEEKKKPGPVKLVNLSDRKITACISPFGWPAWSEDEEFTEISEDEEDEADD